MGTIMQTGTSLLGMGGYLKPTGTRQNPAME
jgi:hypothetical protein